MSAARLARAAALIVCAVTVLVLWVADTLDARWPPTGLLLALALLIYSFDVDASPRRA